MSVQNLLSLMRDVDPILPVAGSGTDGCSNRIFRNETPSVLSGRGVPTEKATRP